MAGPTTREAFIWVEFSEMAPAMFSRPASPGAWPPTPGR